jgi:hypothetical protein
VITDKNSLFTLVETLRQKSPAYLDLLSADTDSSFAEALETLVEIGVSHLEKNKDHFQTLDEEGLSAVLAGTITTYGVVVTQESHSNGHVDLTIEVLYRTPLRRSLAEAKIYNGPEYHLQGLEQLLNRYTTGREGRGFLVVYVRKRDIAALVKKLRDRMDADRPCQQQDVTAEHRVKWWFLSAHTHSSGERLEVSHIGCNLYSQRIANSPAGTCSIE